MNLRLDKVSAPATGKQAAKNLRAVKTGKPISTPQGKTFGGLVGDAART